jgi:hypothetical protein
MQEHKHEEESTENEAKQSEEQSLWECMSTLSVSTANVPFRPSRHCTERQLLRGTTALDVQRAKKHGHKVPRASLACALSTNLII